MGAKLHARLTADPLSTTAAEAFCADPGAGALVVFTGVVRDNADGRAVSGMDYEAFHERAEAQLDELATQVAQKWPGATAVWLEHRVGSLAVGEPSVVVAVSSAHRETAFEAARYAIDTLKSTAAIWKHEHWLDGGSHWPGTD